VVVKVSVSIVALLGEASIDVAVNVGSVIVSVTVVVAVVWQ